MNYQSIILASFIWFMSCTDSKERIIEKWENGKPKTSKYFHNVKDTLEFQLIKHFPNGSIKEIIPMTDKVANGWKVCYHPNGMVKDSIFLRDNIPFSNSIHYHPNGNKASYGAYNGNANKENVWYYYHYSGGIAEMTEYNDGAPGDFTYTFDINGYRIREVLRYPEGTIKEITNYKDSLKHGEYCRIGLDGKYISTGHYNLGTRNGTRWIAYYRSTGQKFRETEYGLKDSSTKLLNLWNAKGIQTVTNGNGYFTYYTYCDNNKIQSEITYEYVNGEEISFQEKEIHLCY